VLLHADKVGVRAAHDQAKQWRLQVWLREHGRVDMTPKVIDAGERLGPGGGQALPHADADQEASCKPGASRHGDQVEVRGFRDRASHREVDEVRESLEVVAGRELGDHAAEFFVQVDLGVDDVRQHPTPILDDCDGRLVAACFDAQR
jgi:hypothetical protein